MKHIFKERIFTVEEVINDLDRFIFAMAYLGLFNRSMGTKMSMEFICFFKL
jgi:hypothetical protein